MAEFVKAYEKTLKVEGGYANHPADKGGETYKGIARNFWPLWTGWALIDQYKESATFPKNIKDADMDIHVQRFYKDNFWDKLSLTSINDQDIAEEVFDTAVNMGTATAVRMLQRACNLLNNNGKLYKEIDVDGKIGPNTIGVVNSHPYPSTLYNLLNVLQGARYVEIVEKSPSQEVFMRGWLNTRVITRK